MSKFNNHIIKWLFLICVISCAPKQDKIPIKTVIFENKGELGEQYYVQYPENGVKRDVPKLYRNNVLQRERQKIESALQIGSLENGFKGIQIRIRGNEYEELDNGWIRFLVISNESSWSADVYYIRFAVQDGFIRTIDSLQYQKHSLDIPKSGWNNFVAALKGHGLFTIPDFSEVPEYGEDLSTDELSYKVEIASDKYYRMYSYYEPFERVDKFKEAMQFKQIIEFIKSQFDFPKPLTPELGAVAN